MRDFRRSGARSRVDDTGATLHIVCPEGVTQLGGDEFKQCEGWHPARRSETGDEIGWHLTRRRETRSPEVPGILSSLEGLENG
jgi:hypothetical protein